MGILNITPDSFSDGGLYLDIQAAIKRAYEIEALGADILDIGAQSTRPGYTKVSYEEECKRLIPVLEKLIGKIKIPISIDTFYPQVAKEALNLGVDIINDVTGFKNEKMLEVVANSKCALIVMHDGKAAETKDFFENQINLLTRSAINLNRVCLDPGIGFGKTYEENLFILGNAHKFKVGDQPMLIGASRKRVIGMSCGDPDFKNRLSGTISAHSAAMLSGADIIRAHDVFEAVQSRKVIEKIIEFSENEKEGK